MKKKYLLLLLIGLTLLLTSFFIKGERVKQTKLEEEIKENFKDETIESDQFEIDFDSLIEVNADVIGWININNTDVDYPVLKTNNNDFYLDRNIYKEKASHGSIFMDFRNIGDGTDRHTIIYGHQMDDGTMFTSLNNFKDEKFLNNNKTFKLMLLNEVHTYEIFSAYVTDTSFYYIMTNFRTDDSFLSYVNKLKNKSYFNSDIVLNKNDKILTLSTCSYEFDNARFVIHAKKLN